MLRLQCVNNEQCKSVACVLLNDECSDFLDGRGCCLGQKRVLRAPTNLHELPRMLLSSVLVEVEIACRRRTCHPSYVRYVAESEYFILSIFETLGEQPSLLGDTTIGELGHRNSYLHTLVTTQLGLCCNSSYKKHLAPSRPAHNHVLFY